MNTEYQYCVCHGGQRWLVWGLVEALVSIQWIRIAQIDTKTHLPTELILHSLPFGRFLFSLSAPSISLFIQLTFERGEVTCPGACMWYFFLFYFFKSSNFKCNICRLQGHWQLYFPSPSSLSPCEIDRLFVSSSNRTGEGFIALLATQAEQKCCWGKRQAKGRKPPHSQHQCT